MDPNFCAQGVSKSQDLLVLNNGESRDGKWTFAQKKGEKSGPAMEAWSECKSFPTSVHVELIAQKKILDPVGRILHCRCFKLC